MYSPGVAARCTWGIIAWPAAAAAPAATATLLLLLEVNNIIINY